MRLTTEDISKIKYEKRIGFVFSAILFTFGIIANLITIFSFKKEMSLTLILIDLAVIFICVLIPYFTNKKYNMDLKNGEKIVKIEQIQKKVIHIVYEAGSGKLYIPILGDLFPKQWGQKMREIPKTSLIIKRARYHIDKELFDQLNDGENIEMHYAKYSEFFLGIYKMNK